ncbi:HES5 factor, partial [Machaerirhynchus nigripectus]|nr:HES5 factor [Machaerirhynchus nigripectus]
QLELLPEKGFQRHQPNSELGKGDILGMAVSAPGSGRASAAPAESPQQDYPDGQCPRAALQFPSLRSTGAGARGELSCHSRRSQVAPGDSASSSAPTSSQQPPAKPAAPKRFQSLRRPW